MDYIIAQKNLTWICIGMQYVIYTMYRLSNVHDDSITIKAYASLVCSIDSTWPILQNIHIQRLEKPKAVLFVYMEVKNIVLWSWRYKNLSRRCININNTYITKRRSYILIASKWPNQYFYYFISISYYFFFCSWVYTYS